MKTLSIHIKILKVLGCIIIGAGSTLLGISIATHRLENYSKNISQKVNKMLKNNEEYDLKGYKYVDL